MNNLVFGQRETGDGIWVPTFFFTPHPRMYLLILERNGEREKHPKPIQDRGLNQQLMYVSPDW